LLALEGGLKVIGEHAEEKIRRIIDGFVADGAMSHLNDLAQVLVERDADTDFFQDLCGCLSGKSNVLLPKTG